MSNIVAIQTKTPIEVMLETDEEGFTTAKKLYEWLELNPAHYARWVKKNILENTYAEEGYDFSPLMVKSSNETVMGRPTVDYRISASFAKKLAMTARSDRGEQARIYFLQCEKALALLAQEKQKQLLERAKGIGARRVLTDVIKESGEDERMNGHAYPIYTDLAYKTVLGMTASQYRRQQGMKKRDSIRDRLPSDTLSELAKTERLMGSLVESGFKYDTVEEILSSARRKKLSS